MLELAALLSLFLGRVAAAAAAAAARTAMSLLGLETRFKQACSLSQENSENEY